MKNLLLSLLMLLGMQALYAAEFTYGICSDEITGVGTGYAGSNYSAAIEVPEAVAKQLIGSKVTKVDIGFKSGLNKVAYVYLTYDLNEEPFYKQEGRVAVNTFKEQVLDTPYVIEGRKFYIGYTYRQSSSTGKPIGFDGQNLGGMAAFSHIAIWTDGGEPKWDVFPEFGALSLRATIEGDKVVNNCVIPVGINFPKAITPNKEFNYELSLLNYGDAPVNTVSVAANFGSNEMLLDCPLESPLAPGQRTKIKLAGLSTEENSELPINIYINKVDGAENAWGAVPSSLNILSSSFIFSRKVVIEEATGIGCGWCVGGYVALEQMRENHPDDYIGIAVHNFKGDPMRCAPYEPWVDSNIEGYPNATISRNPAIGTFQPLPNACEAKYNELAGFVNLYFELQAEYTNEDHTEARLMAITRFGYDEDNSQYGIAFVEVEDNVGPYQQYNAYSGGAYGPMYGFEDQPSYVTLSYNDVARNIVNWQGKPGSVPANIKAGTYYLYDEVIPLKTDPAKQKDMRLIALLINRNTGEIITADRINEVAGIDLSDVNNIEDNAPVKIHAFPHGVQIEGEFDSAYIFGIDGSLCATTTYTSLVELPAGIYVVKVICGNKTLSEKIMIK